MSGDKRAHAFAAVQQPDQKPRWQLHPKCAQNPGFPALFAAWTAAVPKTAMAARALGSTSTNSSNTAGVPGKPTRDHFVFPWESEMSDIEWAVATVLRTKYPEIHHEIIWAACEHGGLLPDQEPPQSKEPVNQ